MEKLEKNGREYYSIDLIHIIKSLWKRAWMIALCGLLVGAIGFSIASFVIEPSYSSSIKLYVNNKSVSIGNTTNSNISASDLTASQSLVRTYGEILLSRTTLELVIDNANLDYTWKELSKRIEYAPSNNTEVMRVTVTTHDPYEASVIANTIADVLPDRIGDIIEGTTVKPVDSAVPELDKVGPSVINYTAVGVILGVLISVIALFIAALRDDTIHDSDYVSKTYDCPILGKVPNLVYSGNKPYGGYYTQKKSSDKADKKEGK